MLVDLHWRRAMEYEAPLANHIWDLVLRQILGVIVERHACGMFLHQRQYTLDILQWAGMTDCKPRATPMDT
jgi:hypothetical protein